MNPENNTWLSSDQKRQVEFYLNSRDTMLVEKNRVINIILDIIRIHFGNLRVLSVLDLGCGDGAMTDALLTLLPDAKYVLLDGSGEMIDKARQSHEGDNFSFRHVSFEQYIDEVPQQDVYDLVVSSMAIHHLDLTGKSKLYKIIYKQLKPNGMFLNYDTVKPPSKEMEELQFELWRLWMNEKLAMIDNGKDVGQFDNIPRVYKDKIEDKPSLLTENLESLAGAGFQLVDCFFKYSVFALFGGIKSAGQ